MPTTGSPWNIYYPDNTAPISPIENLFSTLSTSVASALTTLLSQTPYVVTNPAALDAVATATAGAFAYMTAPGTGISAMTWRALNTGSGAGLDWQIEDDVIIAATSANFTTFVGVIAGLSGVDLQFKVGQLVRITGDSMYYVVTSTAGAIQALMPFLGVPVDNDFVNVAVTGAIAGGTTIATKTFPTLNFASTVRVKVFGQAGGNASAVGVRVALTATGGTVSDKSTEDASHWPTAAASAYTTIMQEAEITIPAGVSCVLTIAAANSGSSIYAVAYEYQRVTS